MSSVRELSILSAVTSSECHYSPVDNRSVSSAGGGDPQSHRGPHLASSISHVPSITTGPSQSVRQVPVQRVQNLENTYRMMPDDTQRFQPDVVDQMLGTIVCYYAPRSHRAGALSDDARLTSVCLTSVAYIGPKSRTERPRKTKIGTEVAHVTRDSDTTFRVKRSKVNLQGAGILWRPPAQLVTSAVCNEYSVFAAFVC